MMTLHDARRPGRCLTLEREMVGVLTIGVHADGFPSLLVYISDEQARLLAAELSRVYPTAPEKPVLVEGKL